MQSLHRTRHHTLSLPPLGNLRLVRLLIRRDPMIAVNTALEAVVVRAIDRHRPVCTLTPDRRRVGEIIALEVPSLLGTWSRGLQILQLLAFVRIDGVEVRVRARRQAAVEAAYPS